MLVEEPDAAPIDLLSGRSANQRMREKRLEIATGISQQAALAIQNDLLQREMVERERLEQEMQLARQIQRTFLPREMPHLDGWELNVRWRTAREVGGDFYDFFELPGGRLGLVIADVADKGMPAALFMVLIRTLVRATVQEIPSPAEVLERVNDVLVPDAHQGMFVTLFYAVIDLNTGEMVYANAGHNPPMLLDRQAGTVERLLKSGMALGVLEGNQVVERRVEIELGDYLVLYTDGVTDSFAPGGAMYGEERLRATIVNLLHENTVDNDVTAGALLDAIETSTNSFIEGQALGDDFTLMILKREN